MFNLVRDFFFFWGGAGERVFELKYSSFSRQRTGKRNAKSKRTIISHWSRRVYDVDTSVWTLKACDKKKTNVIFGTDKWRTLRSIFCLKIVNTFKLPEESRDIYDFIYDFEVQFILCIRIVCTIFIYAHFKIGTFTKYNSLPQDWQKLILVLNEICAMWRVFNGFSINNF